MRNREVRALHIESTQTLYAVFKVFRAQQGREITVIQTECFEACFRYDHSGIFIYRAAEAADKFGTVAFVSHELFLHKNIFEVYLRKIIFFKKLYVNTLKLPLLL